MEWELSEQGPPLPRCHQNQRLLMARHFQDQKGASKTLPVQANKAPKTYRGTLFSETQSSVVNQCARPPSTLPDSPISISDCVGMHGKKIPGCPALAFSSSWLMSLPRFS